MFQRIFLSTFLLFSFFSKAQNLIKIADSIRIKHHIPEISYAIVSKDSILESHSLGYHKINSTKEIDRAQSTDYFHLGSNTKAITAYIAATLVQEKKLNWNTPFFEMFPKWKKNSNKDFINITLEDLLSHRGRIPAYTSGAVYQKLPIFKGSTSEKRKQFCAYVLKNESVNPTDTYHYSNAGYSIAALMLEKASGKTWELLVDELLSKKLKLKYKLSWPNRYQLNQPWGHWIENGSLVAVPPTNPYHLFLAEPAGDISMPLSDYAKFIQLNLNGLLRTADSLTPETYNFLHYGKPEYAMGWANTTSDKIILSEHAGSDGTFFSYTLIDKNKKTAYIILMNCATETAQKGLYDFLEIIRTKY